MLEPKRDSFIKRVWHVIWYVLAYFGIQFVASLIYSLAMTLYYVFGQVMADPDVYASANSLDVTKDIMGVFDMTIPLILSSALFLLLAFLTLKRRWRQERFWAPGRLHKPGANIPLAALLGFAANILTISVVYFVMNQDIYISDLYQELLDLLFANNSFAARLLAIGVFGPIAEEVLFRGIVFDRLRKLTPLYAAVLIQALIFGVMHMNLTQGAYGAVLGVFLALAYHWADSIWVPIIIHITYNTTSLIITQALGDSDFSRSAYTLLLVSGFVITAVCTYLMYINKKRKGETPTVDC